MNDKSLGSAILILGVLGSIAYAYWFLAPAGEDNSLFYVPSLGMRWALVLPVLMGVLGLFLVAIWIGWTMVVTPPPIPKEGRKTKD